MADSTKEICKWLERIADQARFQTKYLKQITENIIEPPELGTAVRNSNGCVMLNSVDFEKLLEDAGYGDSIEAEEDE